MADLKGGLFAEDASQRSGWSSLPTSSPVFSHEISPVQAMPLEQQLLGPDVDEQVMLLSAIDTFKQGVPVTPLQSSQRSGRSHTHYAQRRRQFAPKLLLLNNRLPESSHESSVASIDTTMPNNETPFSFQPSPVVVMPAADVLFATQPSWTAASPYASFSAPTLMPPQELPQTPPSMFQASPVQQLSPVQLQEPSTHAKRKRRQKKPKKKMTRGRFIRRIMVVCSILTIFVLLFTSQVNGASGAWTADAMRAVLGPTITAQVESWYLGLSDTTHQLQYKLSGQQVVPPWSVGVSPVVITTPPPQIVPLSPMPLNRINPIVSPAIAGEGQWAVQGAAPAPYGYLPLDARAFIRPDPSHPYAIVTLLQFDTRFFRLHMVAGTVEPGGPRGYYGPGVIPAADQRGNALLAAFNGGFKYSDGQYGLKTNGTVYVPPQPNAATIAITKSGQILLGAWGVDPELNSNNPNLIAWRQNASLLINKGIINPLTQDGAAWGGTILNSAYTWRSGIGMTANGTMIYAAGSSLTALTLGEALKAAGAVIAMQTDINPFWVRAFLYSRNGQGAYDIIKLNPSMYGTGTEYLSTTQRDFFYLTRYAPPLSPIVRPREAPAQ